MNKTEWNHAYNVDRQRIYTQYSNGIEALVEIVSHLWFESAIIVSEYPPVYKMFILLYLR